MTCLTGRLEKTTVLTDWGEIVRRLRAGGRIFATHTADGTIYQFVEGNVAITDGAFQALRSGFADRRGRLVGAGDGLFSERSGESQTWRWEKARPRQR